MKKSSGIKVRKPSKDSSTIHDSAPPCMNSPLDAKHYQTRALMRVILGWTDRRLTQFQPQGANE